MIEFKRILCAVDFSEHSQRALDHAVAIARYYESAVTALYVFPPMQVPAVGPGAMAIPQMILTDGDRDALLSDLRAFTAVESAPGVVVEAVMLEGYPATEIVDYAAAVGANLIVLGTHGRSGFERLLLGSVAERVLRRATCPVLTVPSGEPDAVPLGYPIFKNIVCPIDFSAPSLLALDYALSLAREADAHLTILHVLALSLEQTVLDAAAAGGGETIAQFRMRTERELEAQLRAVVPADAAEYCRIDTVMAQGKPGVEVVRAATSCQADLIVMGVHGRGALDLALFGSTTQHVVRAAHCPVLTIGPKPSPGL